MNAARSTAVARGGKENLLFATAEDGHHEVKVCEAILKSSQRGRVGQGLNA